MSPSHVVGAVVGVIALATISGSLSLWTWAVSKWIRAEPLLPLEPRRPVPWGLFDLILNFILLLVILVGSQLVLVHFAKLPRDVGLNQMSPENLALLLLTNSLAMAIGVALAMLALHARAGATWADFGITRRSLARDLKLGAGGFLMLAPPMYAVQMILTQFWKSKHPVQTMLLEGESRGYVAIGLFTAVLVAPLAEEMIFRVILQGWLENVSALFRRLRRELGAAPDPTGKQLASDFRAVLAGDPAGSALREPSPVVEATIVLAGDQTVQESRPFLRDTLPPGELANPYASPQVELTPALPLPVPAIEQKPLPPGPFIPGYWPMVLSAAIFAALHAGHGPDPIPLSVLALGLGYLYQRTHRVLPCIVVHFLVNSISMIVLLLALLFGMEVK